MRGQMRSEAICPWRVIPIDVPPRDEQEGIRFVRSQASVGSLEGTMGPPELYTGAPDQIEGVTGMDRMRES